MSVQRKPISQHCSKCQAPAIWGLFAWKPGQTDVDLTQPPKDLRCGRHKYVVKLCTRGGPLLRWIGLKIQVSA